MSSRSFQVSGAFDIECADWDTFVLGACYDGHRPIVFYDCDQLLDHLRSVGGTWWAHAGGVYDLLLVLERCRARGISCQVDRTQHRITRIVIGKLILRDSYALWPVPLDEICGAIGCEIPSLPWRCTCGRDCGGYCRIAEKARAGEPDLEDYCKADCRALYEGLHWLAELAVESKIDLRGTLGQTAWKNAQAELGVPDSTIPWHLWRGIRQADKGGRQAIIRPFAHGPGAHHDICNAYPAQLARAELPIGACRPLGGDSARRALERLRPGVYSVTVRVPEDRFLPPLPWHCGGQLTFPTGVFSGTWTLPELVCAFERGTALECVRTAIVWEATAPIFGPLVERWYELRRELGRKTPGGQWIGRMAKALTGKFAERPDRMRVQFHPEAIKVCLRKGPCRNGCTKKCGAYEQLDLDGAIYGIPYSKLAPSSYPQWSSYLRAMTRVQWLEQAERFGSDLVMGNTDSLWTIGRQKPEPIGDGLGQWEYQHAWTELDIRSISTYAYRDEHGKLQIRGIPGMTEEDWKRGTGAIDRGLVTFGRAVKTKRGLFQKRHRRWTLPPKEKLWWGDRRLGDGGITYPVSAAELRSEAEHAKARAKARSAVTQGVSK